MSRGVDCKGCSVRSRCMGKKGQVRVIQRWEHQEALDRHKNKDGVGGGEDEEAWEDS